MENEGVVRRGRNHPSVIFIDEKTKKEIAAADLGKIENLPY